MRRVGIVAIAALILLVALTGCDRKKAGSTGSTAPPPEATAAAPTTPEPSAAVPSSSPAQSDAALSSPPAQPGGANRVPPKPGLVYMGESTVIVDAARPEGKPPAAPTGIWIDDFIRKLHDAINNRDARFLLQRMAPDVKIRLTLGAKSQEMTARDWFARSMTALQAVENYRYDIKDRKFTIKGRKVALQLWIHETFDENDKTVKGSTYQTMDLEWLPATGDFLVHSMIAESSGDAEN